MKHKFVEFIPDVLEDGMIYISMDFATAAHKCACGCGNEVVTPFSPTDWKMTFNGEAVSLHPSIGNWNFDCQSHYWIKNNRVEWSGKWSKKKISDGRISDKYRKGNYYQSKATAGDKTSDVTQIVPEKTSPKNDLTLRQRIGKWLIFWKD